MKVIKSVFNFYINASIHVALAVSALTWLTLISFELDLDFNLILFVFFATITGYNFIKYFGLAKFHHRSLAKWLKIIQVFSAVAFILMCYFFLKLDAYLMLWIGGLALVTFLYAVPILPKKYFLDEQQNLRQIGGLKVYIIALVWSLVTVLLPVLNEEMKFDTSIWLSLIQRFCFVIVLMLPFEIRDLNYDSLKLSTIPQKIGIKKTKTLGVLVLIVFLILEFLKSNSNFQSLISILITSLITFLFLIFSSKNQSKHYSSFWVEAIPIFWFLTMLF